MAGINLLISKCSIIPMYNNCPYAPIRRRTSKSVDIIPHRSSNLNLQCSYLLATTHLLKNRLYSSSCNNNGYEVCENVGFDGNGFLHKAREVREKANQVLRKYEIDTCFWDALPPMRFFYKFWGIPLYIAVIASCYTKFALSFSMCSFLWILNRWKTKVLVMIMKTAKDVDCEKLLTLDKISSACLFVPGCMALAKAFYREQAKFTVVGIGGVLAAFVAGDILGNILSGLFVKVSQPFLIEDTIRAGYVYAEGKVTEMGLTTTSLLSAKKEPIKVENSLFSNEAFLNKSLVGWRAMKSKIPLQIEESRKIPLISEEITNMLKSKSIVFLGKEQPYCKVSRMEGPFVELSIGCNLKMMSKDTAEHDVLMESVWIIKKHGGTLTTKWKT